jgi:type IV pilus assembly protein PilO
MQGEIQMKIDIIRQMIKTRQRSFICIFILMAVDLGLFLYSALYQEPRLADLQRKWSGKRVEAAAAPPLDPAAIYRQGTADLKSWRGRISPKKDFAGFIGELFETAVNNSLRVGAITYKPTTIKGENLLAYSIGFNVSGKYAAIKSFIADIERFRQIAVIDTLSLNGKADEEIVDMRLQLTAYFRVEG